MSETIERLRAANPVAVEPDRGHTDPARQALKRILSESPPNPRRPRSRLRARLPRGGAAVAIALALAGGGAALAATNPFGWWSSNPQQAKFALNPAAHARTPSASTIGCHRLTCEPNGNGQRYTRIDVVHQPNPTSLFTRSHFLSAIARSRKSHELTPAEAAKLRRDLARVPNSFFTELRLASRYQTYGAGGTNGPVPPPGVPMFLVCEQLGTGLGCQDLNGDQHAPLGAAVYGAVPAGDWRPAPPQRNDYFLPPGIHFTQAEYRVLFDMVRYATASSAGGSRVHATPVHH